jgi:hypothetical protein
MASSVVAFSRALLDHWYWLMGILLMIEPLLDYHIEGFRTWADRWVSRRVRTRVAIGVSVATVFIATFLAFNDEYQVRQTAQSEISGKDGYVAKLAAANATVLALRSSIDGRGGFKDQLQKQAARPLPPPQRVTMQAAPSQPTIPVTTLNNLLGFYNRCEEILNRKITVDQYDQWSKDRALYNVEAQGWIVQHMNVGARDQFLDMDGPLREYGYQVSEIHGKALSWTAKTCRNLRTLMSEPMWSVRAKGDAVH